MHTNAQALADCETEQAPLRQRLADAGCVFDFAVCQLADAFPVDEAAHREMLGLLRGQIEARMLRDRQQLEAHHQQQARAQRGRHVTQRGGPPPEVDAPRIRWQSERATASAWDTHSLTDPRLLDEDLRRTRYSDFEALFSAFKNPPYGTRWKAGLFADFCEAVSLVPEPGVQVLDWVGKPSHAPERSSWSDYFDDGADWWGVWCLTVWNPARRTLSALAASTTD